MCERAGGKKRKGKWKRKGEDRDRKKRKGEKKEGWLLSLLATSSFAVAERPGNALCLSFNTVIPRAQSIIIVT